MHAAGNVNLPLGLEATHDSPARAGSELAAIRVLGTRQVNPCFTVGDLRWENCLSKYEMRTFSLLFARTKTLILCGFVALVGAAHAWGQAPADPTPDSAAPNIFYGAIPPDGTQAPVVVFVHGLKGKASDWWGQNDMYASAYAAGFRTSFISLNADNTPNNTSWSQNGVTLKRLFANIASHFSARLYVVAYDKGGLDVQAALLTPDYTALDPAIAPLVRAVFALGTPNQGSSLADWAFGPGQSQAQQFGLLGPGLQSLEVATVQSFRAQADPVFARSQLQFYTFAGDTPGSDALLSTTSQILAGLTPGPNDGLVALSSVRLPYSYSMDIGETAANHFQMNQGHVSFPVINGSIQGLENEIYGFRKIITGGFGDASNTWTWSMKWFNHKLYVGTGREVNCVSYAATDVERGTHSYPPKNGNCPHDPKNLRLAAEIWQYTPETNSWIRVFQSPEDIPIGNDASGNPAFAARDIGFRSMAVFTEPDGTQALYVGGVSSAEVFGHAAATQGYPPPRILRTTDGMNFTPIAQDSGTFLGDITLNSDPKHPISGFRSMVAYNGMLFVTAGTFHGSGIIIASSDPSKGNNAWFQASPPGAQFPVWTVDVFAGHLWAIGGERSDHSGYFVAYTDAQGTPPYTFTNVITQGGNATAGSGTTVAVSSTVFQGRLYVGTGRGTELVRINPDLSWDVVIGDPRNSLQGQKNPISGIGDAFDNQFNGYFWGLGVIPSGRHQGLVLGTWDFSAATQAMPAIGNLAEPNFGADVFMTPDGVNWTAITTTGFGDGLNDGVRAIESTPFGTFVGTTRAVGGTQIWLDQSALDFNNDGVISQPDVATVQTRVGQAALQPYDPGDLDQDGQITANDVQLIISQCTYPDCAAPARQSTPLAAPTNLVAAPKSASSSTVSLKWNPVSRAVDYRVYRVTQTPLLQFFPPQGVQVSILGLNLTIPQDIINGKLNPYCPPGGTAANPVCRIINTLEQAVQPNSPVGLPVALVYLGKTSTTEYQEQAPTPLQSTYFVRAEDKDGNLSDPSNLVGGPSEAGAASAGQGSLIVSSGPLNFSAKAGSATPVPAQTIQVASTDAPLNFTAAATVATPIGSQWLQVSPASGTAPRSPATTGLTVTANAAGLTAGSYSGTITVTDALGIAYHVNVTLAVTPVTPPPSGLLVSAKSLAFSYQVGGVAPPSKALTLSSAGSALGFTASPSVSTPAGGSWLHVSPASGTAPPSPATIALSVSVVPGSLPAATYGGSITITDAGGNSQSVAVTLTVAQSTKPPVAPPPTPDPTQPNLFYGAIPPNGPNGPVLVFVHGLGGTAMDWWSVTGNDMYDLAYQAGFRTAFVSMNLDNSPNSADIPTNAAMLQTMFPKILAQFRVSKVYFVCHSKGGLDLQAAIVNPQWTGMAAAVFTLGTPNQGDALADWLFSPAGQTIGRQLSLLTPGAQSLETANVQQLRAQWDPVFQNAKIPFYTISGNSFACPGGQTCITAITGPILQSVTGGSKAPANDGFVTQPETALPTTYAMTLGVIHTEHFALRLGDNSFPFIYGHVMAQDTQQPGFSMVSTGGFGDAHNTWAWSMQWFKGKLYVGTGREVACVTTATAMLQTGLPLYPPPNTTCPADYHHLSLQAEIWQYAPATNTWVRVFQSPNSLATTDNNGNTVMTARDIGFRGMTLVTEPDGTQALYAGGVTSGAIFAPQSDHTAWAPPRILRSVDGVTWAPLPQDPGTFLGNLSNSGTQPYPIYSIRAATQYNGILFLQVGDFQGTGRVISSLSGANPATGNDAFQWASPPVDQLPIWILEKYNNFLYAGTGLPNGKSQYGVYKTDASGTAPYTWSPVVTNGAYAQGLISNYAMSMQVFSDQVGCPGVGCLYVGTDRPTELIRIHPDDSWDLVIGNPRTIPAGQPGAGQLKAPISGIGQYFDNGFTGHFWRMGVGGHGLYLSTWDNSNSDSTQAPLSSFWSQEFGTDLFRTSDGIHWQIVSKIAFGDGANTGGRSFATTPFGLFWGTARSLGGTQIFNVDNSVLDYNHDGVIDQNDVNLLNARLNTAALPNDAMDLDQDGQITSADAGLLATQCTYPGCAPPPVLPSSSVLATPTVNSAPGALGGPVSLSWSAVSGAQDYLVYRITTASALNAPPSTLPTGVNSSQLAAACNNNAAAAEAGVCDAAAQPAQNTPLYGYPGPVTVLGRVTNPSYTETSPTNLQSLYFVRTEDANGNLSAPSNVVGGPSLGLSVIIPPGSLVVTPGSLAFSYQIGGALPAHQQIQITSTGAAAQFNVGASISTPAGGRWLQAAPMSGSAVNSPAGTTLNIAADPTGLAAGTYTADITIADASQNTQHVSVTFTITQATPPPSGSLIVSPTSMTFAYQAGATTLPPAQALSIAASGAPLAFNAAASVTSGAANWLQISASSGTAPVSPAATNPAVTVNPGTMAPGSYSGTITINAGPGQTAQVSVTLTISSPPPPGTGNGPTAILVSPNMMGFSYTIGQVLPAWQGLLIGTTGASLPFTVTSDQSWLLTDQTSGTIPFPGGTILHVGVNAAGLATGTYSGTLTISSASASNTPQTVSVKLTVTSADSGGSTGGVTGGNIIPRIIAHLANGQGWKTTILLVNTDTQPQPFSLSFWSSQGAPLVLPMGSDGTASSVSGTIQPGQLRMIQTDGSGDALAEGWASFGAADAVGGTVIFTAQSTGQPPSEAAVPLSSTGNTKLFVPFDQTVKQFSFATGVALANPASTDATVSVTFTDEFGQTIPVSGQILVPAYGHYAAVLGDVFPQIRGKRGVVQLVANTNLYGLGIRFNGGAFTSIEALANVAPGPKIISHLANGQGWKTTILLVNTDTKPAQFTLAFWKDNGAALNLPLGPYGTVAAVSGTIGPGNSQIIETDGSGSSLVEGWANLITNSPIGGTAIFTAQSDGVPPSEAAVPLSSSASSQLFMPFDNTSGTLAFATGLALANPNEQDATITVAFTSSTGQNVPVTGTINVPAHGHYACVLGDMFPAIRGKRGVVQLNSNVQLYGLGIRYNGGAYTSIRTIPPNTN